MELFQYSLAIELFLYIKVLFLKSSWPYSFVFLPPCNPTSTDLILRYNCNSLTIVQVHVPVDDVDHDVGGGEDDPGDCGYLGDRVQSFLRVIHSLGNTPAILLIPGISCVTNPTSCRCSPRSSQSRSWPACPGWRWWGWSPGREGGQKKKYFQHWIHSHS